MKYRLTENFVRKKNKTQGAKLITISVIHK